MGIPFRAKLLLMVAMAVVPLSVVVAGSTWIGVRQGNDFADLEGRLVPKLELGPRLDTEFEHLRQNMQDAVSAQDRAALDGADETRDRLFALLAGAGPAMTPADAASIRWAVQSYFEQARDVSKRLIAGETGETLVADIAKMQAEQAKASTLIKRVTRLDKTELASGFAAVRRSVVVAERFRLGIGLGSLGLVLAIAVWTGRSLFRSLREMSVGFSRFSTGDFSRPISVTEGDDLGKVAEEANLMAESLRKHAAQRDRSDWLRDGQVGLTAQLSGDVELEPLAERALGWLASRLRACAGAFYVRDDAGPLRLRAAYAGQTEVPQTFSLGQGLVGQAALAEDILVVESPPEHYLRARSALGEAPPSCLVFIPLRHADKPIGVIELALLSPFGEEAREFIGLVRNTLVIKVEAAKGRAALRTLLDQAQRQAQLLSAQEEELRLNNTELQSQQENLRAANEELETQRAVLSARNADLEIARKAVQEKADELARVSSYKSQFLANMSHELRTPLNSMLLLSHLLAANEQGNLTPKQVEHCKTVHAAGEDLLNLINQVLDLAKIEAGRQDVLPELVSLESLVAYARRVFEPLAGEKGLRLVIEVAPDVPRTLVTDEHRVERILTNLLGNAIKFTEAGQVTFSIGRPRAGFLPERPDLDLSRTIAFAVADTGIGIAPEAHARVFAPFEQVESHARRRYAGTGLGLAIAKESAELLGGELRLESAPGKGSTFTCYLPERPPGASAARATESNGPAKPVEDDRAGIQGAEPHLLIIEDDAVFAEQLVDIIHAKGLKVVVARTGQEGVRLARDLHPVGIILDVNLPDIDGWAVMERLSQDAGTRAIPVHFISGVDAEERGLSLGAVGYLKKPASRADLSRVVSALSSPPGVESRRVLVVEDNAGEGEAIVQVLRKENVDAVHVSSAREALDMLAGDEFGCVILDLGLPDMDGVAFLAALRERSREESAPRVVVHTGRALTKKETRELEAYAEAVILKDGRSEERLVEEIRLFVRHVRDRDRPSGAMARVPTVGVDVSLSGKTILIAEDDIRTVYALSALLRGKGAEVLVADTGKEALEVLAGSARVDAILMDVMMPEMDGYEATRRLRTEPRYASVPVIAVTAKAMQDERDRCLAAGANDYLTKPVDSERLLTTLQSWLVQRGAA